MNNLNGPGTNVPWANAGTGTFTLDPENSGNFIFVDPGANGGPANFSGNNGVRRRSSA